MVSNISNIPGSFEPLRFQARPEIGAPSWTPDLVAAIDKAGLEPNLFGTAYDMWLALDEPEIEPFLKMLRERGELALVLTTDRAREGRLLDAGAVEVIVWPCTEELLGARVRRTRRAVCTIRESAALRARMGPWSGGGRLPPSDSLGARLQEQLQLLRRAVDVYPGPVHVQDAEGRFVLVNNALAELYGVSPSSVIGRNLEELGTPPNVVAAWRGSVAKVLAGTIDTTEVDFPVRDASRTFRTTRCPLEGPGSARILTVAADVTELRAAQDAANRERERAILASQVKSRFLANMSHEIRTPMNGVLGFTSLLLDTPLDPEQREYLEAIHKSGESLLEIINDILDLSKIEAGKMVVEEVPFDLSALLKDALRPLELRAQQKRLRFVSDIAPGVGGFVLGDPVRLRQVIVNLVGNAIKFTEKGSVTLRVERDAIEEGRIRFRVRDTGVGIPPESVNAIFEPFLQADDKTTRHFGGTGLGLTICRELCHLMGGEISVESTVGEGSCFTFTARASALDRPSKSSVPAAERVASNPPVANRPKIRVLLAEDSPTNELLARRMLEKLDCEVTHAANGEKAVLAWAAGRFDLVLMDVQMPVMDGLEATLKIRASEAEKAMPRGRIAALTANAMKGDDAMCREAGMDDFLTKPIQRRALEALVADVRQKLKAAAAVPDPGAEKDVDLPSLFAHCAEDADLFGEIIAVFLETWKHGLKQLSDAVATGDAKEVASAAHYVKGTGRSMCATRVSRLAEAMEMAARAGDTSVASHRVAELEEALVAAERILSTPVETLLRAARTKPTPPPETRRASRGLAAVSRGALPST